MEERHHDYVLGPNQDARLASVSSGAVLKAIKLVLDPDAPFSLRSRAVYSKYVDASTLTQSNLQFLKTRFSGPTIDYRQQGYLSESVQSAFFGQFVAPKPLWPPIEYPAQGVIYLDLYNGGADTITNLTFLFRGVKRFSDGSLPQRTYPKRFSSYPFNYPVTISQLQAGETRYDQIFTVRQQSDFVLRGGQFSAITSPNAPKNVALILKDSDRKPYSNDFVRADVLFGCAAAAAAGTGMLNFPVGPTPTLVAPLGTGAGFPGLIYPEVYIPANQQMFFDIQRDDASIARVETLDYVLNFIGAEVFPEG